MKDSVGGTACLEIGKTQANEEGRGMSGSSMLQTEI